MKKLNIQVGILVSLLTFSAVGSAEAATNVNAAKVAVAKALSVVKKAAAAEKALAEKLKLQKAKVAELEKVITKSTDPVEVAKAKKSLDATLKTVANLQVSVFRAKTEVLADEKILVKDEKVVEQAKTPF